MILSSKVGIRKPGKDIYLVAAERAGFPPENCMYVGDNPFRDIAGARAANYGMMVIIHEPATLKKYKISPDTELPQPDRTIKNLIELLDFLPPINED